MGSAVRQRLASDLRRTTQQLQDANIQVQRCRFHMDDVLDMVLDSISQERLKGDHARLALASLRRNLQGQQPSSQQLHDVFEATQTTGLNTRAKTSPSLDERGSCGIPRNWL